MGPRDILALGLAVLLGVILSTAAIVAEATAAPIFFTVNLRGGPTDPSPTPFITFVVPPEDSNADTWFETVMKINLRDPSLSNPYDFAEFRLIYDGPPIGLTANIGDSSTNNGGSGDFATQSNDAEMQIGSLLSQPTEFPTLRAFGNDNSPPDENILATVPDLAGLGRTVLLTVGDDFLSWDNGLGTTSFVVSPFLYALNGQPDSEGPVNYDVFAAFNRVIDTNFRIGAGVGEVTVCLRSASDPDCFPSAVPEPPAFVLVFGGLGVFVLCRVNRWAS